MSAPNDIVLYLYTFSPFAQRVTDYLAIRGIAYAQCRQPPIMPRPDLELLNIQYRRIPLMAIGNDVYADTRLILRKLEEKFPYGRLSSDHGDQRGVERLLERWVVDGGVFTRATQLIPPDLPLLKDPKFQKDRQGLMGGRDWGQEAQKKGRPEALIHIRDCFEDLEHGLLADGRDWILKTDKVGLGDIEIAWVFNWLVNGMKGALPKDMFNKDTYPKVYGWLGRYTAAVKAATAKAPKPTILKGPEAAEQITSASSHDNAGVDATDPLGLWEGATVTITPIDYGFTHRDMGRLVKLTKEEVAVEIETKTPGKKVWFHCPRWGFRIVQSDGSSKL